MTQINISIKPSKTIEYPILIEGGLLTQPKRWLPKKTTQCVIINDDTVKNYYGEKLNETLKKINIDTLLLSFPAGELSKVHSIKQNLENKMFEHGCDRDTLLLALGGGVTGDLAGFVAATYLRGIPYLQLPTTLLAMVDSSVGGKTGINNHYGKNLIGAFIQPQAVVSDLHCLRTLPEEHQLAGLIEAIKLLITHDKDFFEKLINFEKSDLLNDETLLCDMIARSVTIKSGIVERDEKEETGERSTCNFGHTIAHALEKMSDYQVLHGFAVALGILVEIRISQRVGILSEKDCLMIESFFEKLGFSTQQLQEFDIDEIINATHFDKKVKSNQVHYVLLQEPGQVFKENNHFTHPIKDQIVKETLLAILKGT